MKMILMRHHAPLNAYLACIRIYKNQEGSAYSRDVFMNVIRGNVGKLIAEAFVNFIESDQEPLITFDDVLGAVQKARGHYVYG